MNAVQWEDLWWILWIGAVGACVGSFLNMLVYRLPRDRSLLQPKHSYCPTCESAIAWYDNIPLLSYVRLGGRCRNCRVTIPVRYPLVEALCAISFMLIADAFYVGAVRPDLQSPAAFGVTGQVAASWPVLVGHLVMIAALLAVSAMDIEEYYVDIRVTWTIVIVGLAMSLTDGLCKVKAPELNPASGGATVAACAGLLFSWGFMQLWYLVHPRPQKDESEDGTERTIDDPTADAPADGSNAATEPLSDQAAELLIAADAPEPPKDSAEGVPMEDAAGPVEPNPLGGCVLALTAVAVMLAWAAAVSLRRYEDPAWVSAPVRLSIGYGLLFFALLASSIRQRPADTSIIETIEAERGQARLMAVTELIFLMPAMLLAAGIAWWLTHSGQPAAEQVSRILQSPASLAARPLNGIVWTLMCMLVAGGIGWGARLVFTLILGKEALGMGDVHIMWAAGAVVGWGIVLLSFFAGAFLAVIGLILLLGFKRSRAIPFGPWLALGVLLVVLARAPVLTWLAPAIEAGEELLTRLTD